MKKNVRIKLEKAMDGVIKKSKQIEWLNTSNEELDGKTPLEVISEDHIEIILNILNDIETGIPT